MTMSIKELQELMELMNAHKLVEFNLKDGDFEIAMRSEQVPSPGSGMQQMQYYLPAPNMTPAMAPPAAPQAATTPAAAAASTAAAPPAAATSTLIPVKSPMPGTFYRSSSPDKPPFVKVGDTIEAGQVVCMIEAMKLFNELESEVGGRIVKVLVEDASPVEYDQVLFMVEP